MNGIHLLRAPPEGFVFSPQQRVRTKRPPPPPLGLCFNVHSGRWGASPWTPSIPPLNLPPPPPHSKSGKKHGF